MATSNWLERLIWQPVARDVGPLLARIAVGSLFLSSGWIKLHKLDEFVSYFGELGIPAPDFMGRLVVGTEFLCGAFLLLGLLTRPATIPLIVTMILALATALREKVTDFVALWSLPEGLYIVLLVWLALEGGGRVSVDHFIRLRLGHQKASRQPGGSPSPDRAHLAE